MSNTALCQNRNTGISKTDKCMQCLGEASNEQCYKPFPPRMTQEEFSKEQEEILNGGGIPKEFKDALSYMAYEQGHSGGYEEVICCLRDLVEGLSKPIADFEKRVFKMANS